ncbi:MULTISPECIES: EthD domain-containing protein [Paenibacillus]|uniref:EthD domain-containing protein n=1 Tax=Paenibacillus TaxID=44249 RepID=UPI001C64C8DA|nr:MULTISPECIES: EthD domain-containing protein [Paenibacillus]QYK67522.1 EthD domain protein [Paenibacillus sp. S02]
MESIKELNVYPEKGHSIMFVFRRKPGMSLEEFRYHYEFTHGPLATKLPGLISYRQHPTRKPGKGDEAYVPDEAPYDAVSLYIFENAAVAEAAWVSPQGLLVDEDTLKFIDTETMISLPVIPRQVL